MKTFIVNTKGGILKTTMLANLGSLYAKKNQRTLIIDLDGNNCLPLTFGKKFNNDFIGLFAYLIGDETEIMNMIIPIDEKEILEQVKKNLFYIPCNSSINLYDEYLLKGKIDANKFSSLITMLDPHFEHIIIASAPGYNKLTEAVLDLADHIVIPFELNDMAVSGLETILEKTQNSINSESKNIFCVPVKVRMDKASNKDFIKKVIVKISLWDRKGGDQEYIRIRVAIDKFISLSGINQKILSLDKIPLVLSTSKSKQILKLKKEYYKIFRWINKIK